MLPAMSRSSPAMPGRRLLLAALALPALRLAPAMAAAGAAPPALQAAWAGFQARFVSGEGRVVDNGNGGISHSEGQGWAMLAAARCGDREGFERLWDWTQRHLRRPQDRLFAWRHRPGAPATAADRNNAADGDLFVAASLLLAGRRWPQPAFTEAGTATAEDVLRLLLRDVAGRTVLLPGLAGFEDAEAVTLNPSYYAFPAIRLLARAAPDPAWLRLAADGVALLRGARFGRWGLPPDWLRLRRADGVASLAPGWPPRFSYDAVRVPLYLGWAGLGEEPAVQAALAFWNDPGWGGRRPPAWADLATDAVAPFAADGGILALRQWAQRRRPMAAPPDDGEQYYVAMLKMLTLIAEADES